MKKRILVLVIGFLLIGINGFAADGDLIVNGNVGIGTTSPAYKLDVQGQIHATQGTAIYAIPSVCGVIFQGSITGMLTTNATCSTSMCPCGEYACYFDCAGGCTQYQPMSCNTTFVGRLIVP
jgi:hypothetical protein